MTTAEGRKTEEVRSDADFSGNAAIRPALSVSWSLDGTADRPAAVSRPLQYLPRERNGWIATLQTTVRSGVF